MGTLEMAISSVAFLGAFTDSTALLDLPYLFQSNEAAEEVLDGEVGQEIFSNLEPAGFKGMTWMATGWRQSVSYTHLDVYKRQHIDRADRQGFCQAEPLPVKTVFRAVKGRKGPLT